MPTAEELVRQKYGFMAWALDIPEVGDLLRWGAAAGWGEDELKGALQNTRWWKGTTETQRAFDQTLNEDKQTAMASVAQMQANILAASESLGIRIDPNRLGWMSLQATRDGWSGQQIKNAVNAEFRYVDHKQQQGSTGAMQTRFAQMAREYGVPWTDDLSKWFVTAYHGQEPDTADNNVRAWLVEQAKSRYPYLGQHLDAGMTTRQYMSPYLQDAARILEKPVESFTLDDPIFSRVMGQLNPETMERSMMSAAQAQDYYRSLPEYRRTKGALEQASNLTAFVGQRFGVTA